MGRRTRIKDVLDGSQIIDSRNTYGAVYNLCMLVRFLFLIIFFYLDCLPLCIFSVVSLVFYFVIVRNLLKTERYWLIYYLAYSEIALHSLFACVLVGWTFGFSLYNLCIIPISFYMSHTTERLQKVSIPITLTLINLAATLTIRSWVYIKGPIYSYKTGVTLAMSIGNCAISFLLAGYFSCLTFLEIHNQKLALEQKNKELYELANFDYLTKLHNRRSMNDILHQVIESESCDYSIVLCDIDDFKLINDTYGHNMGDVVLAEIANLLNESVTSEDAVCRWGGEEILILLKGAPKENLNRLKIMRKKISEQVYCLDNTQITATLTYGIEHMPSKRNIDYWINRADAKMYYGKNHGKDCIVGEELFRA